MPDRTVSARVASGGPVRAVGVHRRTGGSARRRRDDSWSRRHRPATGRTRGRQRSTAGRRHDRRQSHSSFRSRARTCRHGGAHGRVHVLTCAGGHPGRERRRRPRRLVGRAGAATACGSSTPAHRSSTSALTALPRIRWASSAVVEPDEQRRVCACWPAARWKRGRSCSTSRGDRRTAGTRRGRRCIEDGDRRDLGAGGRRRAPVTSSSRTPSRRAGRRRSTGGPPDLVPADQGRGRGAGRRQGSTPSSCAIASPYHGAALAGSPAALLSARRSSCRPVAVRPSGGP